MKYDIEKGIITSNTNREYLVRGLSDDDELVAIVNLDEPDIDRKGWHIVYITWGGRNFQNYIKKDIEDAIKRFESCKTEEDINEFNKSIYLYH